MQGNTENNRGFERIAQIIPRTKSAREYFRWAVQNWHKEIQTRREAEKRFNDWRESWIRELKKAKKPAELKVASDCINILKNGLNKQFTLF